MVVEYTDHATGILEQTANGSGRFIEAILHPVVKVKDAEMIEKAIELHKKAHE